MDAFTQLLESYLSDLSNRFTDALALDGLNCIAQSLQTSYHNGSDVQARGGMAWAAYLSGVTLANAGLGVVHGFGSSVGAHFNIPHGVICSALMAPANEVTIRKLRTDGAGHEALVKYATAGRIFAKHDDRANDYYIDLLSDTIRNIAAELRIPGLSDFGVNATHFSKIIAETGNKNNPVHLDESEMEEVLRQSL
jgi:alcohol dehydrogenase class IV